MATGARLGPPARTGQKRAAQRAALHAAMNGEGGESQRAARPGRGWHLVDFLQMYDFGRGSTQDVTEDRRPAPQTFVDAHGRVIGVNTSGLSRHTALTLPAVTVDRTVNALLSRGRTSRGYSGVGMQQVRLPDDVLRQV